MCQVKVDNRFKWVSRFTHSQVAIAEIDPKVTDTCLAPPSWPTASRWANPAISPTQLTLVGLKLLVAIFYHLVAGNKACQCVRGVI